MQEVPLAISKTDEKVDLLSTTSWDSGSVDADVFAGFLDYQASKVNEGAQGMPAPQGPETPSPQAEARVPEPSVHQHRDKPLPERTRMHRAAEDAQAKAREKREQVEEVLEENHELKEMKDMPVDSESFQAMKPQLDKYGLSKEDIEALEKRVNSEAGITWGNLVAFISSRMASERQVTELSAGQRQKLMTFFQKLGFSAPESQRMVGDLAAGNADKVLSAVERQLKELPQDKLAGLDKNELEAFLEQIRKIRGEAQSKELGLARVVGKAMEEALDKARRLAQIAAQQQTDAQDAKARGLDEAAQHASGRAADQIQANIQRIRGLNENAPAAEQARQAERDAERLLKNLSEGEQLKAAVGKAHDSVHKGVKLGDGKAQPDLMAGQDETAENKAWNEFFEKLRLDRTPGQSLGARVDSAKGMAEALNQARSEQTQAKPWERTAAPRAIKQVEDAVLKSLTGGGKRLTIQLKPEHLGQLAVALTVKNSEVSATIRADNHETAQLIANNLESLKQTLEQQGLKVNRLEVQTQLAGGDNSGWQGLAQQGNDFEQQLKRGMRSRFGRTLGPDGEALAQDMNDMAREAILSGNGNGLHVIA